jgi:Na+/H+ antiporter NhaD/arsenite permease-like protein
MELLLIAIFVLGYLAITLEHTLKIDKLIPALAMMALLWAIIALAHLPVFDVDTALKELVPSHIEEILLHHLGKTAEIIIFLLGAMTIVEIIDYFNGFAAIKAFIKTKSKKSLLWIFAILAFILSAIIDNLTATIVLITILQKVILDRDTRLVCGSNYRICQCRWCMVTNWRRDHNNAVDWKQSNHRKTNCLFVNTFYCVCGCTRLCCVTSTGF